MHFWPKNGNFRQLGPYNGLPNSRMGTYRKTKGIQSYLRIWGCYDPIESGPSETKKGGLYRCSVKKSDFGAIFWPKNGPWRPPGDNPAMRWHKKVVFQVSRDDSNNFFLRLDTKKWFLAKKQRFWALKGPLWAIGAMKRSAERPNGHLPENRRYPELPQDMGDLWSHWVGTVWAEKMGVL